EEVGGRRRGGGGLAPDGGGADDQQGALGNPRRLLGHAHLEAVDDAVLVYQRPAGGRRQGSVRLAARHVVAAAADLVVPADPQFQALRQAVTEQHFRETVGFGDAFVVEKRVPPFQD